MHERRAVTGFAFLLAGAGTLVVLRAGDVYGAGRYLPVPFGVALLGLATDPRVDGGRRWGAVAGVGVLVAATPALFLADSSSLALVFVVPLAWGVGGLLYLAGVVELARRTDVELVRKASLLPAVALPLDVVLNLLAPFLLGAFGLAWMAFGGALAVSNARRRARTGSRGW